MKFEKIKTMKVLKFMSPCSVSVVKRSKELLHIDTPERSTLIYAFPTNAPDIKLGNLEKNDMDKVE